MAESGLKPRDLLNPGSRDFKKMGGEYFQGLTDEQLLKEFSQNGKLMKRPLVLSDKLVIQGFDEAKFLNL